MQHIVAGYDVAIYDVGILHTMIYLLGALAKKQSYIVYAENGEV